MRLIAIASAAAALAASALLLGAAGAQAQGFASYGAYLPTHEYYGYGPYIGYGYGFYGPRYAEPRMTAEPAAYSAEYPGYSGWRRGQRLPEEFRSDVFDDYASAHLSRPPRGYAWYHDADDYILAAQATGLIARVIHEE